MKLIRSTKSKINKNKNGVDVPHLGITEVVFVHSIVKTMIVLYNFEVLAHFCPPPPPLEYFWAWGY